MGQRQRKVLVYRLTISGLPEGTRYGRLIDDSRRALGLAQTPLELGAKSHSLYKANLEGKYLTLLFMSYTTGHRPDILDVEQFSLSPNPLAETQTGVDWTHCVLARKGERYLMLLERLQAGIHPKSVERYLQWMLDKSFPTWLDNPEPVVVTMEPEPGEEFIERLTTLDRIKSATYRFVRPNPGWEDLETELAEESEASDAQRADVTMVARRGQSLQQQHGIIAAIKDRYNRRRLDYARVSGTRDGHEDSFDTEKLMQQTRIDLETDTNGQVVHDDAWGKMKSYFEDID